MAWYNINSQDSVTAETLEKIRTERCGFCGQEKPVKKRMKIYCSYIYYNRVLYYLKNK